MRSTYLFHGLLTGLLVLGCAKDDPAATEGGSDTESGSDADTGDTSGSSNSGGNACIPGMSVACSCPDGGQGAQVCAVDGKSFGACECEGSSGSDSNATSSPTDPSTDPTNVTVDPSNGTTTDATSTTDATTTTDGSTTTTTDGSTTDGTTGGVVCDDPGPEPNEVEDDADDLGDQACQAMDGNLVGVLDGDADADWSVFHGLDGMGCGFNDPLVALTLTASDAVRLCVFADCDNGMPDFNCPMGTMTTDSPDNRPGCCGDGDIVFGFNCAGSPNESADFFVRVDQAPAGACVDYSVEYSFGPP